MDVLEGCNNRTGYENEAEPLTKAVDRVLAASAVAFCRHAIMCWPWLKIGGASGRGGGRVWTARGGRRHLHPLRAEPSVGAAGASGSVWAESRADYAAIYPKLAAEKVDGPRAQAFWSMPLVAEGQALGMLGVGFFEPRKFSADDAGAERRYSEQDLEFVEELARRAAMAIENAIALKAAQDARDRERWLREEAERTNRLKDDFLATASHELRTPLNAILGWTLSLRRSVSDPDADRALAIVERNARAQAKLIEDVLDVSRIVSGKLVLTLRSTSIRSSRCYWCALSPVSRKPRSREHAGGTLRRSRPVTSVAWAARRRFGCRRSGRRA